MRRYIYLLPFCLLLSMISTLSAQSLQTEFGKNRVQYHDDFDEWSQYESRNFITYWYGEGRYIGQSVVQMAEMDFEYIQNILEHRINDKIEIIVYKDLTDLKQSNIGTEETFINTGGLTKIVGNKVFVYFDGDHTHLRKQIREGIAEVYLNAMLFGSNLQEIVQNAVMMNLPDWFKQGLVAYVGEPWNTDLDNRLRDIILDEEFENFEAFSEEHPKLAGQSLWYFISQNYGKSTVSNLLYLTRINRSIESGFLYVLGSPYGRTINSWESYFRERYDSEKNHYAAAPDGQLIEVKKRRKDNHVLTQLKISPDGKKIAFVANEIGKYKVIVQDIESGDQKVIYKDGFKNAFQATDYEYPLLAWNPSGFELSVIYEKRDVIYLMRYDMNTKDDVTEEIPNQYHRIHSMDFVNNNDLIISATSRGISDLFIYKTVTRQSQRITNDFYDDLDASFVTIGDKKGILFASNRQDSMLARMKLDSILPTNRFDIFYYDLENKSSELVRVTNTPLIDERQPNAIDSTYFTYLSNANGINNRQMAYIEDVFVYNEQVITLKDGTEIVLHQDSTLDKLDEELIDSIVIRPLYKPKAFSHNNSNYHRNIESIHSSRKSSKLVEMVIKDGDYLFYTHEQDPEKEVFARETKYHKQWVRSKEVDDTDIFEDDSTNILDIFDEDDPIDDTAFPSEKQDSGKVDIDNYMFQSEFDDEEVPAAVIVEEDDGNITLQRPSIVNPPLFKKEKKVLKFRPSRIIPYRLKFRTDFVTTQLDNSLLFGGLDSYAGSKQEYSPPAPGILLKANFKDLFEDYVVEGGVRIPTTFNGAEYFLIYDDKKKRVDKRFALYRRSLKETQDFGVSIPPGKTQETIMLGFVEAKYPLDIFRSLRGSATLRGDKIISLATDRNPLATPSVQMQRFGLKAEYVFDNTFDVSLNIKHGSRYKIFVEGVKRFQVQLNEDVKVDFADGLMGILGVDARHYQKLDKHSIIAARFSGSTTIGSERILYFIGGEENWLFPSFNQEIPFPTDGDYAYQTLASHMRGFRMNIRNGSSFMLLNTEIRVPIFNYFSKKIRSSFFRNFQVVGFFDVGTAWQGATPFSDENPLNTSFFFNPPLVSAKINYFRDPIVAGYGLGVRSTLFGYFVRLDYAWGIETRQTLDPIIYLSLGMDF